MRELSSFSHLHAIGALHAHRVLIDDPVLPAAVHLTGPRAIELLRRVVATVGGDLAGARPVHVVYRPGSDLVVRYSASIRWHGAPAADDTLIASTNLGGAKPGTLVATAHDHDGRRLEVSVWRWPYDPHVPGLTDAVTPNTVGAMCTGLVGQPARPTVRAYRPTERAVVHVGGSDDREVYLKAVAPSRVLDLAERHRALLAGGCPVPAIHRVMRAEGVVVMEALRGETLRDQLKRGTGRWPDAEQYRGIWQALGRVELPPESSPTARAGRAGDALGHAAMLAAVLPSERARLTQLCDDIAALAERSAARATSVVHGDLYESQLVVGDGARIVGVLDVDDVRRGDPIDDRATVLAHLLVRALDAGPRRASIEGYAASLRSSFAEDVDRRELDLTIAAVMIGLATGPFRVHHRHWQRATRRQLDLAARLVRRAGERNLRTAS